jgi:type 1 glutamine amidotransferase
MAGFDALVLYDMPGLDFRAARPNRPGLVEPPAFLKEGFRRLLESGKGVVALHHAIAAWPAWPDYAEWLGGRFLYRAAPLRGIARPDSGYRHDVAYEAEGLVTGHPVLAGLPERFPITDEVYLYEVFAEAVQPLLRARHNFVAENFYSAELAVAQGRLYDNKGWSHPPGPDLIGWVKRAINSPLVYLQPGDGPATYANPHYRRLLANAIRWVASPAARA